MFESIQQRIDQRFSLEQLIPIGVVEVGGNNGWGFAVAFAHQLKESVNRQYKKSTERYLVVSICFYLSGRRDLTRDPSVPNAEFYRI